MTSDNLLHDFNVHFLEKVFQFDFGSFKFDAFIKQSNFVPNGDSCTSHFFYLIYFFDFKDYFLI